MPIAIPSHSVLRPHGTIIITDPEFGHEIHKDVLSCCHCQRCWVVQPGSGKRRGFCVRCGKVTCGAATCDPCTPMEERLELYEAGKITTL